MFHCYRLLSPPKIISKVKTSRSFLSSSSPSSCYPVRLCLFQLNQSNGRLFRGYATAAVAAEKKGSDDTFFADDTVSWKSLGLSDRLASALENSGFGRPSIVQVPFNLIALNIIFVLILILPFNQWNV